MSTFANDLENERRRLMHGPRPGEKPSGLGTVRFRVRCPGNAEQVLEKAKAVLNIVNQRSSSDWPSEEEWRRALPAWFVSRFAPELSQERAEEELRRWRALSREEQIRWEEEQEWSLSNWIYWFQPGNRQWYWWDGIAVDADTLIVAVEVKDWPFPWGALRWLFRALGAYRVEADE